MTVASVCSSSGSEWPPSYQQHPTKMGRLAREREIERAVEGDRESCRESCREN